MAALSSTSRSLTLQVRHHCAVTSTSTTCPSWTSGPSFASSNGRQRPSLAASRGGCAASGASAAATSSSATAPRRSAPAPDRECRHQREEQVARSAAASSPLSTASTETSHAAVPASATPRTRRTVTIHFPGRGSRRASPGNSATAR